jgi:hypothetical protein
VVVIAGQQPAILAAAAACLGSVSSATVLQMHMQDEFLFACQ